MGTPRNDGHTIRRKLFLDILKAEFKKCKSGGGIQTESGTVFSDALEKLKDPTEEESAELVKIASDFGETGQTLAALRIGQFLEMEARTAE